MDRFNLTHTYDALNRLTSTNGDQGYKSHTYTYDSLGNLINEKIHNKSNEYWYNELNQQIQSKIEEKTTYHGGGPHWATGTDYAMPMQLELYDNKNNLIFSWNPDEPNWWLTGFDPSRQGVKAEDLTAKYTLDFSNNTGMYDAFYARWGSDTRWTFNPGNNTATLIY